MKKLAFCTTFLFLLVSVGFADSGRETKRNPPQEIEMLPGYSSLESWAFRVKDSSEVNRFNIVSDGSLVIKDSSGQTDFYVPSDSLVIIDSTDDLSTWGGAESGSSYFQMKAGKTYLVDPFAIASSGCADGETTALYGFSAVTAHMPLATADTHLSSVKVILVATGVTGYDSFHTGTTPVEVWPAPLTGSTQFRNSIYGSQNMVYRLTSSTTDYTVGVVGDAALDKTNENTTWMLFYDSSVSAQISENAAVQ